MLYKFLTVLLIFSASITFAVDLPKTGEKRELENIFNDEQSTKKMAIFLLHKACEEGDIEKVKELLMTENINQKDGNGNTPILAACAHGQAEVVQLLLGEDYIKYININECNNQQNTLLHLSCKNLKNNEKIIEKIINHQHICINYRDGENNSALMIACINDNLAAIKLLLKHPNIDVNYVDKQCPYAPLHEACAKNKKEIVKELLKYPKTDTNLQYKLTPLHIVCKKGNEKIVKLLLKSDKININQLVTATNKTALSIAVKASKPNIVKLLLEKKEINIYESDEYTVFDILFNTIKNNKGVNSDIKLIIEYFIKYTWEQIYTDDIKILLDTCMKHKEADLVSLILDQYDKKKYEQIQKVLNFMSELDDNVKIKNKFNINVEDLFLSACYKNDENTLQMLIEKYDINNSDLYNKGLIRVSDSKSTDKTELAKLLISHNANVNYLDDKNMSPLHHACNQGNLELVKLLVDNNADINSENKSNLTPLDMALTKYYPSLNVNKKKDVKNLIEYLLNKGALYSESFNENENTKALLKEIKTEILAENAKSMW